MRRSLIFACLLTCLCGLLAFAQPASAAGGDGKGNPAEGAAADDIPADARAKMAAQKPLSDAANRIQKAVDAGPAGGFTGIALGAKSVELYWKGTVPARVAAAVTAEQQVAVVVRPARYSLAELKGAERKFMAYVKSTRGAVFGVRVPVDGSGLVAQTTEPPTAAKASALRTAALGASGVEVRMERSEPPVITARQDDVPGFYGGGRLTTPSGGGCSTGFAVIEGATEGILTAGHCGNVGGTFLNGNGSRTVGQASEENVAHDLLLIPGDGFGRIFDGGGLKAFETRSQFTKAVSGWGSTFANEWVCQSGMTSGAVCNIQNSSNVSFSYCASNTGECYSDLVLANKTNGVAVRGGDSGGPVFTLDGARVSARGIVSGQNFYPFQIVINGRCLDADANNLGVNGTRLQLWDCNGSQQQRFYFRGNGSIVSATSNSQFCVDADLNTIGGNGTIMQLWQCNGSTQQQFNYGGEGTGDIRSAHSGRCIDADLNTIGSNGTIVQLWDCNGQNQQLFRVSTRIYYQDFRTANADFGIGVQTAS